MRRKKRNLKLLKTNVYHMRHKISMPLYIWWKNNCYEIFIWKVIKLCNWKANPSQHEIIMQLGNEHILCPLVLIIIYVTFLPHYFSCLDVCFLGFFKIWNKKITRLVSSNAENQIYHSHAFPGISRQGAVGNTFSEIPAGGRRLSRPQHRGPQESHVPLCSRKKLLSSKLLTNLLTSTTYDVSPKG